jgi:peptidoglycan/xylan/chitin deacetylase (PgdA/CDA1 family)
MKVKTYLLTLGISVLAGVTPVAATDAGQFFCNGPKDVKAVALTFDDGPGTYTEKILEVLKKHGAKATFFMEGSQVDLRPAIAQKVRADGHEIGSHLYSHPNFYTYREEQNPTALLVKEMDSADKAQQKAISQHPLLLRIPHGYVRNWVKAIAKEKNYILVNWTFGCDWKKMSSKDLADAYIKHIQPGAIFLMHDGGRNRQATTDALPVIIEELQKRGYKTVTVSELLKLDTNALAVKKK